MKTLFLLSWRQWRRGGARTWFTLFSALVCAAMLGAIQFGGASLAAAFGPGESRYRVVVLGLAQALNLVVILLLALLLRGAFSLALSERVRMLGQLASMGATRRQLRRTVWMDAALLSLFSAPLGLACAVGGLALTFRLLGPVFQGLAQVGVGPIRLTLTLPGALLALACPTAALFLAAWGPARRAAKLTPIGAVRGLGELPGAPSPRQPRSLPRLLAARNVRRSPRRFRAQAGAILLCALLVLAADGFGRGLLLSYRALTQPQAPYRLYLWVKEGDTAALSRSLLNAARKAGASRVWISQRVTGWDSLTLFTLDDKRFEAWYGSSLEPGGDQLAAVFCPGQGAEGAYQPGDTALSVYGPNLVVRGEAGPLPDYLINSAQRYGDEGRSWFVTSQSEADRALGTETRPGIPREFQLFADLTDASALTPALEEALRAAGGNPWSPQDTTSALLWQVEDNTPSSPNSLYRQGVLTLLGVFVTGFEALAGLGCAASLLGSILAEGRLRRGEFGLLRSLGLTRRQLGRTLWAEALGRLGWGLGLGLPLGAGLWVLGSRTLLDSFTFSTLWRQGVLSRGLALALSAVALGAVLVCLAGGRAVLASAFARPIREELGRE